MSFATIIDNTARVAKAAGFREHDYRSALAQQPEQGAHRRFQVSADNVTEVYPDLGVAQNRRTATVKVGVAYFVGGGTAGGGDRLSVNCQAIEDMWALACRIENPLNYDSANTGLRSITGWSASLSSEAPKLHVWELSQQAEWEEFVPAAAVAP